MLLYTYQDAQGEEVDVSFVTVDLGQARDHAARRRLRLIETWLLERDSSMIEDYTAEDESDG